MRASLQAVVDGKADAFVGLNFTAHRMLRDQRFSALQAVRRIDVGVAAFRFAAAAEHAALIHELDRRLADLPDSVVETLRDRWLREDGGGPTTVPLSAVEREALFAHKTLRYTVPRLLPPFSMEGPRGQPEGLTIDFLTPIGRILNVDFLYVPTAGPEAAYAALGDGRVDLIAGAVRRKNAPHGALDAGVYSRVPLVIVTRKDSAAEGEDLELVQSVVKLNVPLSEARKAIRTFGAARVRQAVAYTKQRIAKKNVPAIDNVAAYFRKAVAENWAKGVETEAAVAPSASLPKAVLARTPEEAKSQYIAARITEAQGYFAELDPEEQEAAISRYNEQCSVPNQRVISGKKSSKAAQTAFYQWLAFETWGEPTSDDLLRFILTGNF